MAGGAGAVVEAMEGMDPMAHGASTVEEAAAGSRRGGSTCDGLGGPGWAQWAQHFLFLIRLTEAGTKTASENVLLSVTFGLRRLL